MSQQPIFTVGYGARDIDTLINLLKEYEISYLIDVRSRPYSRFKPEFSKTPLEQQLTANGIRYVFMGDALGGQPDDPSCYDAAGKVDYEKCALRPQFQAGIERLQAAHEQQLRVALMCSEGKPEICHRTKLIAVALEKNDLEVMHIDEQGDLRSHEQVMLRIIKGQPSLFGDDFFKLTSRKTYTNSDDESE